MKTKYYIPEVIVCADTFKKEIEYLHKGGEKLQGPKVMIAVVEGDHHEIGNIVKIMLESANFK